MFALVAAAALVAATPPTLTAPCACPDCHGDYRFTVKADTAAPDTLAGDLTPSAVLAWPGVPATVGRRALRTGRETAFYAVTGRVTHVKAEPDGDLHVQLADTAGTVVVEVPLGPPWCALRATVLGWTTSTLPFRTSRDLPLRVHPTVRVVGKAFYDGEHHRTDDPTGNRRRVLGGETAAVWEIHPVMRLEALP
jgi:hypothetical protein